jgi:hypothetical protein
LCLHVLIACRTLLILDMLIIFSEYTVFLLIDAPGANAFDFTPLILAVPST